MHLTAVGRQARGCEMHQFSRGLRFSNTAAWRGLNGYHIMKKYILLFNIWEKYLSFVETRARSKDVYIWLPCQCVR